MEKTTNDVNFNKSKTTADTNPEKLKIYKKPKLTIYGDISDLVLANGGTGTDGSGFPPVSLT